MTSYNLFEHKRSHLSILLTLFFFCFVLSYNKAVPNHFHNRAVPNHFHTPNHFYIKFLICSCQCRINHLAEVAFATGPALFKIMIQISEKIRLHFCKKVSARIGSDGVEYEYRAVATLAFYGYSGST